MGWMGRRVTVLALAYRAFRLGSDVTRRRVGAFPPAGRQLVLGRFAIVGLGGRLTRRLTIRIRGGGGVCDRIIAHGEVASTQCILIALHRSAPSRRLM